MPMWVLSKADARIRTADPFITRVPKGGQVGAEEGGSDDHDSHRCPHCGGHARLHVDPSGRPRVRGGFAGSDDATPPSPSGDDLAQ